MRKRKRPYLLLEVLIAFSILLICLVPLIKSPMRLLKLQISSAEKSELSRLELLSFAEVKKALYKNEIPWEVLSQKKEKPLVPYPELDNKEVLVYGMPSRDRTEKQEPRKFHRRVYFWKLNEGIGKEEEELLLVNVRFMFEPLKGTKTRHTFDHQVFVKKATKNAQKTTG